MARTEVLGCIGGEMEREGGGKKEGINIKKVNCEKRIKKV